MKKLIFLLAALLFAIRSLFAADPMVTQIRVLDASFDKLSVATGIRVELANGKQYLEVKALESLQDDIETYVRDGQLIIRFVRGRAPRIIRSGDVTVKVAVPLLRSISCSSGARVHADDFRTQSDCRISVSSGSRVDGTFSAEDVVASASSGSRLGDVTLRCDDLTISTSSGSSARAHVECEDILLSTSSGSRIDLSGRCEDLSVSCSSGSRAGGYDLIAGDVVASASSGSRVEFTATGAVRSNRSSGASIDIRRR